MEEIKKELDAIKAQLTDVLGYLNTLERWRHMRFSKPEDEKKGEKDAKETND